MNVTTNLKRLFASIQTCEKRLPSFIESLEKQKSNLEKRRDAYDAKEYLTDRQEEIYEELDDKISELEDQLDTYENILSYIQDMNTELMGIFPTEYDSTALSISVKSGESNDEILNLNDNLEDSPDAEDTVPEQTTSGTFTSAILAAIATKLTNSSSKK